MTRYLFTCFFFFLLSLHHLEANAQTTLVFNLDLKQQLADSVFVPGRGDMAELSGNMYPLERNRNMILTDGEPIDSVYSVEITFQRRYQGELLEYNFVLRTADGARRELLKRRVPLQGGRHILDPTGFDAFAW